MQIVFNTQKRNLNFFFTFVLFFLFFFEPHYVFGILKQVTHKMKAFLPDFTQGAAGNILVAEKEKGLKQPQRKKNSLS